MTRKINLMFNHIAIITETDTFQMRLSSSNATSSGILEQRRNNGTWGAICARATFTEIDLICKHLGFQRPNSYMYAYLNESGNRGIWNFIHFSVEDLQKLEDLGQLATRPRTFAECSHNKVLHIVCQQGKLNTSKL